MTPYVVCEELAADGTYGVRGDAFANEREARASAEKLAQSNAAKGNWGWRGKVSAMLVLDAKDRAVARFSTDPDEIERLADQRTQRDADDAQFYETAGLI